MQPYSIYLHLPFCHHRCCYCDFNTYTGLGDLIPEYTRAICAEIEFIGANSNQRIPIKTVFFGGGTPSLLSVSELEKILEALFQVFDVQESIEISLEANPEDLSYGFLQGAHRLGINRLSLGMQSADTADLRFLERRHDFHAVANAVSQIRKAGFDNFNLDLIFGIPDQTLERWQRSMELALTLEPDHLSLYALTIERGTRLAQWANTGLVREPDPDLAAEMYEWASEYLDRHGYVQYEISNWAREQDTKGLMKCEHNMQYWRNLPYLGLGAGAHGFAKSMRLKNVMSPIDYIQDLRSIHECQIREELEFPLTPATVSAHQINREVEIGETMIMGLRLTSEGISRRAFQNRFGVQIDQIFKSEIKELIGSGLLEWAPTNNDTLRLTPRGRLLGNQVFLRFL